MALQRIGNRSVYVLTPPEPDVARTSTGEAWSQYYTNLRWKTWAAVAESQAEMRQLQQLAYKANVDIYEQQRRDLQRQIYDMREIRTRALAGGNTAGQIYRAQRDRDREIFQLQRFISDAEGGRVTTTTSVADILGFQVFVPEDGQGSAILQTFDDPVPPPGYVPLTKQTTSEVDVQVPSDILQQTKDRLNFLQGLQTTDITPAGAAGDISVGGAAISPESPSIQQIDEAIRDYERELEILEARPPQLQYEDPLAATRRAYAAQIGVGTPFGMFERPTRELPFFDERQLAGRIQDVEDAYTSAALQRLPADASIEDQAIAIENARAEARNDLIFQGIRRSPAGEFLRREDAFPDVIPQTPIDARTRREQLLERAPEGVPERGPAAPLAGPYEPGAPISGPAADLAEFEMSRPAPNNSETIIQEEVLRDDIPPETVPETPPAATPMDTQVSQAGGVAVVPGGAGGGGAVTSLGGVEVPANQVDIDAVTSDLGPDVSESPRPDVPVTTPDFAGPIDAGDSDIRAAADEFKQYFDDFQKEELPQYLIDRARNYYRSRDTTVQVDGGEVVPILETPEFQNEYKLVGEYLKDLVREDTPVQQYLPADIDEQIERRIRQASELPVETPQGTRRQRRLDRRERRKTRAQEKQFYFLERMKAGAKLVEQPKKLERFAKTDLPKEERPEVATLVEDLMNVSRGRSNYFRNVFDEIEKYYKDDPKKKAQAHEYLAALQILEGDTLGV